MIEDQRRNIVVIQQGARRNYIYARQLEAVGRLKCLITDVATTANSTSAYGHLVKRYGARRVIVDIPKKRLVSSALPNMLSPLHWFAHEEWIYPIIEEGLALSTHTSALARSVGRGDIIINYLGNGGSFLQYAKKRGATIVTDFIVTPNYLDIETQERQNWPGWESDRTSPCLRAYYKQRISKILSLSDIYLCPSPAVARDLANLPGFDPKRVRHLPYGASSVLIEPANPKIGRVLFAGAAGLRKGIPYLAEAASLLKKIDPTINVVVAGHATRQIATKPEVRDLVFLGHQDRSAMAKEFSVADVFCLPTLAEGSATSIFEALANGLPVITTLSAGSVINDTREGFVVPERNGQAIADAILKIVTNRKLRARMSLAARAISAIYSNEACGQNFLNVIQDIQT